MVPASEHEEEALGKELTPTAVFDHVTLWNADRKLDEGGDEYARALDEWVRLSSVVCTLSCSICELLHIHPGIGSLGLSNPLFVPFVVTSPLHTEYTWLFMHHRIEFRSSFDGSSSPLSCLKQPRATLHSIYVPFNTRTGCRWFLVAFKGELGMT